MRWKAQLYLPGQSQFVSIEIMAVPSYDPMPKLIRPQYQNIPATDVSSIYIQVESEHEILADKLVAFAARPRPKWRDYWDIAYLADTGIRVSPSVRQWVDLKIQDYQIDKKIWLFSMRDRLTQLKSPHSIIDSYQAEMLRFLPSNHLLMANKKNILGTLKKVFVVVDQLKFL